MVDILIIEDNIELGTLLKDFLKREGYTTYHAQSGEEGMRSLSLESVKLVLLDIMLPNLDGFGVCRMIREKGNTPIIIMSAKIDKEDKLAGLELGADDYIDKPFDIDILLAKIRGLLWRSYGAKEQQQILNDGNIEINKAAMSVKKDGEKLTMTLKEYELLVLFLENAGKTLQKDWLFNKVWGLDSFSEPSTLTVHINKLRDKIEVNPKKPERIVTVWGVGYKYEKVS
ncbi:DNA-binding response regulator, OmpR family, contains REC and winged-helix (wHTH) domain [Anaerosporobacter mobilis DSM 15930]|jgi:DNA-binding response OmpR family regulator|uniref:Stage 0 sporulation protein A homolog n=1 Tax=Anaerosporobacter mobilis DSM 15930 TaxID=1120996 RepID=A0A1M7G070_9FIRM|nr:response regulator transcription factor [Anaerosporobacter mobilis]SHM09650.1 DNA-binding response regulator, OmpR family, contains REC and winged-helix (wHTH) domain [Anaerosporobacter mobilis DSM 15930]